MPPASPAYSPMSSGGTVGLAGPHTHSGRLRTRRRRLARAASPILRSFALAVYRFAKYCLSVEMLQPSLAE